MTRHPAPRTTCNQVANTTHLSHKKDDCLRLVGCNPKNIWERLGRLNTKNNGVKSMA
jgi:hypothetical protein